jgi:hypothetical protein
MIIFLQITDFKSRKRLETVPQTPQSAEPRKNPFTSKASTSFAYSSDSTMFNPDAAKIMPHYLEVIKQIEFRPTY